jgi:hypothetical protein
MSPIAR